MAIFNEMSTRRMPSPWGAEVKKRLIDRAIKQDDLVFMLQEQGCNIDKSALSNLLYGMGVSNRRTEIERINRFLDIPYSA